MNKKLSMSSIAGHVKRKVDLVENKVKSRGLDGVEIRYDVGIPTNPLNDRYPIQNVETLDHRDPRNLRVTLYCPGSIGLGHMRRNLLIAEALARTPSKPAILLICGSHRACAFAKPPKTDFLALPSIRKKLDGGYESRYLGISVRELAFWRRKLILESLMMFKPDVFIADHLPRGLLHELTPALEHFRVSGSTRCVLGMRDVLQDPETVHREWSLNLNEDAIRDYYDAIWIYGDPTVYDLVHEYHLAPDVAAKVCYTGYLDQRFRLKLTEPERDEGIKAIVSSPGNLVLCLTGGGDDGAQLTEAFAQAELPPETVGVVVTGPYVSQKALQRLYAYRANNPRLHVLEFLPEPIALLNRADRVIAMGGYNTICELLSFKKKALIVPRVSSRPEQLIRAQRMQRLGLFDIVHPSELSPQVITEWLACDSRQPKKRGKIDLNGLSRIPQLVEDLIRAKSTKIQIEK